MKKLIFITILLQLLISGCGNNKKENKLVVEVKPNGDSLITSVDKYGIYDGPFTAYYHDSSFATGYFKQGFRDSLYELFWPNGLLQMRTQYIHNLEEGYRYYFDLTDSSKNYEMFMRHNEEKIYCERFFSKTNNLLEYKYYKFEHSKLYYIGNLVFAKDTFDFSTSTYFLVYPDTERRAYGQQIKIPVNKKSIISMDFFKMHAESFVEFSIDKIENLEISNTSKYSLEKTNYHNIVTFHITVIPKTKGWHFITGTIKEFNKAKGFKITPVYFNYYVY